MVMVLSSSVDDKAVFLQEQYIDYMRILQKDQNTAATLKIFRQRVVFIMLLLW